MPPVKVAQARARAVAVIVAYTLSGGVSSLLSGSMLGLAGGILLPYNLRFAAIALTILVACAAVLREAGRISFPIPLWNRQTNGMWGRTFIRPSRRFSGERILG